MLFKSQGSCIFHFFNVFFLTFSFTFFLSSENNREVLLLLLLSFFEDFSRFSKTRFYLWCVHPYISVSDFFFIVLFLVIFLFLTRKFTRKSYDEKLAFNLDFFIKCPVTVYLNLDNNYTLFFSAKSYFEMISKLMVGKEKFLLG